MSGVLFHSEHEDTVRLAGAERAYMASIVTDIYKASLNLNEELHSMELWGYDKLYAPVVNPAWYGSKSVGRPFLQSLETCVSILSDNLFVLDGQPVDTFCSALNTTIAFGSDPVILAARIHGQCEVHAYIEGRNRKWLAEIIEQGLEQGIYRRRLKGYSVGWEDVITLLKKRDDEPVVTSYTVCDSFPDADVAVRGGFKLPMCKDYPDEPDYDAFHKLPKKQQWELAMKGLRKEKHGLELNPRRWKIGDFFFGDDGKPVPNGYQISAAAVAISVKAKADI